MRLAAVDIGSNTVHALVADVVRGRLVDVAHYVEMPELGAHVARTGAVGARAKPVIRALRSLGESITLIYPLADKPNCQPGRALRRALRATSRRAGRAPY